MMNRGFFTAILALLFVLSTSMVQSFASGVSSRPLLIRGGQLVRSSAVNAEPSDSLAVAAADSLQLIAAAQAGGEGAETEKGEANAEAAEGSGSSGGLTNIDSLARAEANLDLSVERRRKGLFTDSMSLSAVSWASLVMPGYGQFYNKQYWKLPIFYGALAAGITLYVKENQRYKPLKAEYDEYTTGNFMRDPYLDDLQSKMIRSNTRRQFYLGATIASYIYTIGDAAVNYSTNDVSSVKRATTLATICPGAGQIYNKSYWKVPFVVGGFASLIYVLDWNNRGYKRFKEAYLLAYDYENSDDPDTEYPDGSLDEFGGRYSSSYLKDIRDSYRRNRDMSIIFLAGLYIFQIIDAHVDAHLQDFDVSDDLAMSIEPTLEYAYSPVTRKNAAMFGFNIGFKF